MTTTRLSRRETITTKSIRHWIEGAINDASARPAGIAESGFPSNPARSSTPARPVQGSSPTLARRNGSRAPGIPTDALSRDTGSGVDFGRRGLVALLERTLREEAVHLVAAASDRITRSGYPLIRHVVELSGRRTELLEEDDLTEQFDVRCLVASITSFRNAHHGKRSGQGPEENRGLPEGP